MNAPFAATKHGRVVLLSLRGNQLTSLTLPDDLTSLALLAQVSPKALAGLVFEELQRQPVCMAMHPRIHWRENVESGWNKSPKSVSLLSRIRTHLATVFSPPA